MLPKCMLSKITRGLKQISQRHSSFLQMPPTLTLRNSKFNIEMCLGDIL